MEPNTHIPQPNFDLIEINEIIYSFSTADTLEGIFNTLLVSVEEHKRIQVGALFLGIKEIDEGFKLSASEKSIKMGKNTEIYLSKASLLKLQNNEHLLFSYLKERESGTALSVLKIINCHLLFPIVIQDCLVGLISCCCKESGKQFLQQDLDYLRTVTMLCGMAIRSLRNKDSLENSKRNLARKVFELESVGEINRTLTESLDLNQVIHAFLLSIIGYLGAESGCFFLYDSNEKSFYYKSSTGHQEDIRDIIIQFSPKNYTILEMEKYILRSDEMPTELKEVFDYLNVEICLPLSFSRNIIGLSFFGEKAIGIPYKESELQLASLLVSQAISPLRNSQLYVQLIENNAELKHKRVELEETNLTLQQKSSELETANQKMSKEILERKLVENQVKKLNDELEHRVMQRTAELRLVNGEMQQTLEVLQTTQEELVQAEKMASLGSLVAGVAHEINTPLGVSLTAVSYLRDVTGKFQTDYPDLKLKRSDLEEFVKACEESSSMILTNLKRAASLVASFKEVSTDQSIENSRAINIHDYLESIIINLQPKLKDASISTQIIGDRKVNFYTDPGAFSRIISSLIMNSLIHAFPFQNKGDISIDFALAEETLSITYADNGKGIKEGYLKKIFDPFFTTNRGQGGTGLGLHIVFNLVTQKLKGSIKVESTPTKGTKFYIKLPTYFNQ